LLLFFLGIWPISLPSDNLDDKSLVFSIGVSLITFLISHNILHSIIAVITINYYYLMTIMEVHFLYGQTFLLLYHPKFLQILLRPFQSIALIAIMQPNYISAPSLSGISHLLPSI